MGRFDYKVIRLKSKTCHESFHQKGATYLPSQISLLSPFATKLAVTCFQARLTWAWPAFTTPLLERHYCCLGWNQFGTRRTSANSIWPCGDFSVPRTKWKPRNIVQTGYIIQPGVHSCISQQRKNVASIVRIAYQCINQGEWSLIARQSRNPCNTTNSYGYIGMAI